MAKIEKKGDNVTLTMTIDEAVMLNGIIERAGSVCARARHHFSNNGIAHMDSEISMKQLWSLSDHLSTPTETGHSYTQEFRLP